MSKKVFELMLNSLKNWFLYKLIHVLDHHYERSNDDQRSVWWNPNHCEPTVQLALRDVCRPGDVAFDVGANYGHLSVVMSRLVGPKGMVCSFEASPRNLPPLQSNLNRNGCGNVRVVHAAVSEQSGSQVGFVYGNHPPADRLGRIEDGKPPDTTVPELALDDFVQYFSLEPRIVKMDIEGAEFAALKGFRKTLEQFRPIIILETDRESREGVKYLRSLNYRVVDLSNYHELQSETDFPGDVAVSNVICLPAERPHPGYDALNQISLFQALDANQFRSDRPDSWITANPVNLPAGRYLIDVQFDGDGASNHFACGLRDNGNAVLRYHASSGWIRNSYRSWTWHCHHDSKLDVFFEFLDGTRDPDFKLHGVRISRVEHFELDGMTRF